VEEEPTGNDDDDDDDIDADGRTSNRFRGSGRHTARNNNNGRGNGRGNGLIVVDVDGRRGLADASNGTEEGARRWACVVAAAAFIRGILQRSQPFLFELSILKNCGSDRPHYCAIECRGVIRLYTK